MFASANFFKLHVCLSQFKKIKDNCFKELLKLTNLTMAQVFSFVKATQHFKTLYILFSGQSESKFQYFFKMFSNRLFRIFYILTQVGNRFGSFFISVDLKTNSFGILDDPQIVSRMKRNYILIWIWTLASLALVGAFYVTGMT